MAYSRQVIHKEVSEGFDGDRGVVEGRGVMVRDSESCSSWVKLGEEGLVARCEFNEGHAGNHQEFGESVDEDSGKNVSVIIE